MKTFYRILILPFRLSLFGFIVQSIPLEKFDIIIIVVVVGLLHSSRIKNEDLQDLFDEIRAIEGVRNFKLSKSVEKKTV